MLKFFLMIGLLCSILSCHKESPDAGTQNNQTVSDWTLISYENFENTSGNWSIATRTTLNGSTILGGYNVLSTGSINRTIDLSAYSHSLVKLSLIYYAIDSWDGEKAYVNLDTLKWEKNINSSAGASNIGGGASNDNIENVELIVNHSGNSITLTVGSQLDQSPTDESFGIDEVKVWVK